MSYEPKTQAEIDAMGFPDCVVATVGNWLMANTTIENTEYRAISESDPTLTAAFDVTEWIPGEYEMRGFVPGMALPVTADYRVAIDTVIKHSVAADGEALHRQTSREIRAALLSNADLAVALGALSRTDDDVLERMQRWQITGQRMGSEKISGAFVSLTSTEFTFTVEMHPA
jgi:hypothetical protein